MGRTNDLLWLAAFGTDVEAHVGVELRGEIAESDARSVCGLVRPTTVFEEVRSGRR
jgi:hypothetical protein